MAKVFQLVWAGRPEHGSDNSWRIEVRDGKRFWQSPLLFNRYHPNANCLPGLLKFLSDHTKSPATVIHDLLPDYDAILQEMAVKALER